MRRLLLATTILALAGSAEAAPITPGHGSITDAAGNVWVISPSGSIQENGAWVAGGGGTSRLEIDGSTIYGEDASGKGWFTFSTTDQAWTLSPPPMAKGSATGIAPATGTSSVATAPSVTGIAVPAPVCGGGTASGGFHVQNGRIIDPSGKDWIARGFNVADKDMGSAGSFTSVFPGINFVRLAVYDGGSIDAPTAYSAPSKFAAFVNQLTSKGIVVEFEHHVETDGSEAGGGRGGIASGGWLAEENTFYASIAAAFKGNPYVWFGTTNEPPSQQGLSQWQLATYQAIRGTGNNNPILLEISGWPGGWMTGLDPAVYRQMRNVVWDPHYYGWISRSSTDQATVDQALADEIAAAQAIKSADGTMPVIIAEYGPSTTGDSMDANGVQAVTSVINAGGGGRHGSAAWHWGMQDCCNNLNNGSSLTSPFGQQVALFIGVTTQACSAAQTAQNAQNTLDVLTQQATDQPATPTPAAAPVPADPTATTAQADQLVQQADAAIAAANQIAQQAKP